MVPDSEYYAECIHYLHACLKCLNTCVCILNVHVQICKYSSCNIFWSPFLIRHGSRSLIIFKYNYSSGIAAHNFSHEYNFDKNCYENYIYNWYLIDVELNLLCENYLTIVSFNKNNCPINFISCDVSLWWRWTNYFCLNFNSSNYI